MSQQEICNRDPPIMYCHLQSFKVSSVQSFNSIEYVEVVQVDM